MAMVCGLNEDQFIYFMNTLACHLGFLAMAKLSKFSFTLLA